MNQKTVQFKSLVLLLGLVTVAFIWILLPFYGAVFWAVILGIIFAPMQRRLQKLGWKRNLTSLATLVCLVIAILPVIIISPCWCKRAQRSTKTSKAASWTWPGMSRSSSTSCRRISSICSTALAWVT